MANSRADRWVLASCVLGHQVKRPWDSRLVQSQKPCPSYIKILHTPPHYVVKPRSLPDPLAIVKACPHVGSSAIPTIYLEGDPCATPPVRPAKIGPSPSIFRTKRPVTLHALLRYFLQLIWRSNEPQVSMLVVLGRNNPAPYTVNGRPLYVHLNGLAIVLLK